MASKIKEMGSDALIVKANVGKREEIDAMFKEVTEKWGRVDVLVNNAGEKRNAAKQIIAQCQCHSNHSTVSVSFLNA